MRPSHVAGKTQPAQQDLTKFMFSSGDHSYLWFHSAVREWLAHIFPHTDILWILELAGRKFALWGSSGRAELWPVPCRASAGKQSSIKECPKCPSLWASTVEAWGQEVLLFSRDVKLNAPLFVTSPDATLFLQEVVGSFNLFTCQQQSRRKPCCWRRSVACFQAVRQWHHGFKHWWVKAQGRRLGERERGEAVVHRESFHLISW